MLFLCERLGSNGVVYFFTAILCYNDRHPVSIWRDFTVNHATDHEVNEERDSFPKFN